MTLGRRYRVFCCLMRREQILGRAGDAEESMRKLAADVCREMWFGTGSSTGGHFRISRWVAAASVLATPALA